MHIAGVREGRGTHTTAKDGLLRGRDSFDVAGARLLEQLRRCCCCRCCCWGRVGGGGCLARRRHGLRCSALLCSAPICCSCSSSSSSASCHTALLFSALLCSSLLFSALLCSRFTNLRRSSRSSLFLPVPYNVRTVVEGLCMCSASVSVSVSCPRTSSELASSRASRPIELPPLLPKSV
jgi:hypothetical protein